MPELRHLRYFVAVAEELNFSRAARRLRMAQPPLSVAIRQLEQELGADLFLRTSREVKLTEAGRALLDGARRTLAEADRAMTAARRAASGELGALHVAFSWSARFETLPLLGQADRKSTRLNSSHVEISYAVFCLKKKKKKETTVFRYEKKNKNGDAIQ